MIEKRDDDAEAATKNRHTAAPLTFRKKGQERLVASIETNGDCMDPFVDWIFRHGVPIDHEVSRIDLPEHAFLGRANPGE